ncbi:MAG: chromosomal replication initiator protein DnaA [Microthrixaceae bacterium]|nr:chromosomal replication initiator protein DnaA [Microthrixaceae bacterium]
MSTDAISVWDSAAAVLAEQVTETVWNSTFSELNATGLDDEVLTLSVPSQVLRQRIEQRYRGLIEAVLADEGHGELSVVFEVEVQPPASPGEHTAPRDPVHRPVEPVGGSPEADSRDTAAAQPSPGPSGLGGQDASIRPYTFDSFVTGPSNRFAHAAALSVAETPARSYNPLFVYGGAGLGKTHLLYAIAGYVRQNYSSYRVRYISTETMLNEFVEAIRNGTQQAFKQRYREIDVLLVDDIQFIEGKEQLQEEFFHTFNTLHDAQRQIVLSSDRPPDSIATLEERLRSRFKMGLMTDIQPPDFETRLAILRKKGERAGSHVPPEVLEFIATNITYNIRELEGALIRVNAFAALNDTELNVPLAQDILSDILNAAKPRLITAAMILEKTSEQFGFTIEQLCSTKRSRDLVHARQVSMYVCRELTDLSYPQIGAEYGGKDHTTVLYAYEKISKLMKERLKTYEDVTLLIQSVLSGN